MKGRKPADRENEIKLALPDAATGRHLLRRAGFHVTKPRVFETNLVFDTLDRRILGAGSLLRIRQLASRVPQRRGLLTYKGPALGGRHKSRMEIESFVDAAPARAILERLGFAPVFRYEKFRTEFAHAGASGVAMLDETPIGVFLELEGTPRWVDRTAKALGFTLADYITKSYGSLHLEFCAQRGLAPRDMVFRRGRNAASQGQTYPPSL